MEYTKTTETAAWDDEWRFIIDETHTKKAMGNNSIERELLFILQLVLNEVQCDQKSIPIDFYFDLKKVYLRMVSTLN